ncbi:MAG: HAD family hydrolase [Fidelibacterota bacterium]
MKTDPQPLRIAMWSGPRNISTALMRSFENRKDTAVTDEPFYAHYLLKTGHDHPGRETIITSQEADWKMVVRFLTGPVPGGKAIWYQKHMAHHILPHIDMDWALTMTNCFLIRDPKEVILSYLKQIDIPTADVLGYRQQLQLYEFFTTKLKQQPLIIDARDVLVNPEGMLRVLCDKLGIKFTKHMLKWPAGARDSDGVWAPYWYFNVQQSTGFLPYRPPKGPLPEAYDDLYQQCLRCYEPLYKRRLTLDKHGGEDTS